MFSSDPRFTAPSPKIESRIDAILAGLSLEEKIDLLGGHQSNGSTKGNAKAGIPELLMSDGPTGVHWHTKASTTYPALVCAAATWDTDLAYEMGWGLGSDASARGIHILLAPGVNIYRSPLCGRNFEYCGEDPYLASQIAAAYIEGVQDMGVAATVKHYAVNYQEFDRHNVSSDVDERTLHEIYLPAFKAAITDAGCGCVMTAYNLVNGVHCSEHDYLINKVLKKEWGFQGLVMSDWVSTYSAAGAANGGLDLEMPTAQWMNREKLLPAVESGEVSEAVIDDKVRRLLRLAACFGWLDTEQETPEIPMDDPETRRISLEIARSGVVLLKNDGLLPLDRSQIETIAVVGPNAHPAVIGGGGSSYNRPTHEVSILDGIRAFVGDRVQVMHAVGPKPSREWDVFGTCELRTEKGDVGLYAEYFDNESLEGQPVATRVDEHVHFGWGSRSPIEGVTAEHFSVRWTGYIRAPRDGSYVFYANCGDGGYRVWLDDHVVLDTWDDERSGTQKMQMHLTGGVPLSLRIEYRKTRYWAQMHFGWENQDDIQRELDEALSVVEQADAVVLCVGFDARSEGEGFDRPFAMHEDVDRFVVEAAKRNPNTIMALFAGGNVDMRNWIGGIRGLLHVWYPGQEGGTAVAEVLFGAVNPSGKLPITFEEKLDDNSANGCYHDSDGDKRVALEDGIFTGYRHFDKNGVVPRFAFGFGLSYTTFEYRNLKLSSSSMSANGKLTVSFEIENTGELAGAEVAQVYVSDRKSSLPRPPKELKGFSRVHLDSGEKQTVEIVLDRSALAYYDPQKHAWVVEPGEFEVLVGASAADIRLRQAFKVTGKTTAKKAPARAKTARKRAAGKKAAKKSAGKAARKRAGTTTKKATKKTGKKAAKKSTGKAAKKTSKSASGRSTKKAARKSAKKTVKKAARKTAGKTAKTGARKAAKKTAKKATAKTAKKGAKRR
ncbi:MAG: hypothetical protein GF331_03260 [Chitinivibrionales bacterium]|nr:hypothetical protein [Chitinivibrionales bacterium]